MVRRIIKSKTLTEQISCVCKCKSDSEKYNSDQKWNKELCRCECKKSNKTSCVCTRLYFEFLCTCL